MRIIVDGDSCPVLGIIEDIVNKYNIEAYIYCDYTHSIESDYLHVMIVSKAYQSVDMKILSILKKDDILITNDYGLASLGLTHNIKVISYNGFMYDNDNINSLLNTNYLNRKGRHSGYFKGPRKRSKQNDIDFKNSIEKLVKV